MENKYNLVRVKYFSAFKDCSLSEVGFQSLKRKQHTPMGKIGKERNHGEKDCSSDLPLCEV